MHNGNNDEFDFGGAIDNSGRGVKPFEKNSFLLGAHKTRRGLKVFRRDETTACDDDDDDGPLCKVDLERDPTKVEGRVSDVARAAAGRRGVRHERSTSAYLSRLLVDPVRGKVEK